MNNFAYIDGQNLHSGVSAQRWKLDHAKFREYLRTEQGVAKAFIFLGFMEEHQDLYNALQEAGFILVFKPLVRYDDGQIKGNVDADMVLKVMVDYAEYDKAVIVSGDGDFAGLIRHLASNRKLKKVIIPNKDTYSSLFKRMDEFDKGAFIFIRDLKNKLQYRSPNYQGGSAKKPAEVATEKSVQAERTSKSVAKKSGRKPAPKKRQAANQPAKKSAAPATTKKVGGRKTLIPKKKAEANLIDAIENA